jgi:hypothetical protein
VFRQQDDFDGDVQLASIREVRLSGRHEDQDVSVASADDIVGKSLKGLL